MHCGSAHITGCWIPPAIFKGHKYACIRTHARGWPLGRQTAVTVDSKPPALLRLRHITIPAAAQKHTTLTRKLKGAAMRAKLVGHAVCW